MLLVIRLEDFLQRLLIKINQHQIGAASRKNVRNDAPQTAGRAGDQRYSIFEIHVSASRDSRDAQRYFVCNHAGRALA